MHTISRGQFRKLHNISLAIDAFGDPVPTMKIAVHNALRSFEITCAAVSRLAPSEEDKTDNWKRTLNVR
jgi:hypothetical protein